MKKVFPFLIIIVFVGAAFLLIRASRQTPSPQKRVILPTAAKTNREKTYVLADIASHATAQDCWLAIDGGVYDVTPFIQGKLHPGGAAIMKGCGKDASQMFGRHSDKARALLPDYKIGILTQ